MAVAVNAWALFRIGGELFIPATTMATIIRAIPLVENFVDVLCPFAGLILACAKCYVLLSSGSLAVSKFGDQASVTQGLFIKVFLLVVDVFSLNLGAQGDTHRASILVQRCSHAL
ncbi:hypothetical protein NX059_009229 [Plenodomus lindquistii]|nr:hypothetical protein NX059_009229 [Plenodomus lindquistii]